MSETILVVDDEPAIREMLAFSLRKAGFNVLQAAVAQEALNLIADERPDLVLMDWMLPGTSGVDLTRRLKKEDVTAELPIIMLTARGEEDAKVRGLDSGADDYITKPFSPRELVARIKAVLRRFGKGGNGGALLKFDALELDPESHRVSVGERDVSLGPTEYRLLNFFMGHPERVYSRSQLLDHVWGNNVFVEERTVDVHIRRLRKALSPFGYDTFVQTVRGAGYRFSSRI